MTASVVITCYNLERFIGEAIRSVLDQVGETADEILVVDDCSTDQSADVIREFGSVRYLRTPTNGGVLNAMLLGVTQARNDVVCLLDGDDRWHPEKLAQTLASFANPSVGLSTHDLRFVDAEGTAIDRPSRPHQVLSRLTRPASQDAVRRGIVELRDYVWLGSALSIRKSAIDWDGFVAFANALPDPANTYQDWPLAVWAATRPHAVMDYVDSPLFDYRLHGANHSGDSRDLAKAVRNFRRSLSTLEACRTIIRSSGQNDAASRRADGRVALAAMQLALYEGRRGDGLANAIPALKGLNDLPTAAKEAARLAIGVIGGPEILIKLASRSAT